MSTTVDLPESPPQPIARRRITPRKRLNDPPVPTPQPVLSQEEERLSRLAARGGPGHNGGPALDIDGAPTKLARKQADINELLARGQRHTCIIGGSRSGKTTVIVRAIVARALKAKSRHAILRFRSNAVWPSIGMDTFPKVMATFFPGVMYREDKTLRYFEFENGSQIWLGGLDDKERAEKILGNEYSTIFFNECSQIPYSSILIALSRLAEQVRDATGKLLVQKAIYDLNPSSTRHWTNIQFGDLLDPITNKPLPNPEEFKRAFINPSENPHLGAAYLQSLDALPERHRKRFRDGLYVDESDNSLWKLSTLIGCRVYDDDVPSLTRIVVAVDPSGAKNAYDQSHDAIGIVVAGVGEDGKAYVLADRTLLDGPAAWANAAVLAYHTFRADSIVAETNFGGAMVESVLRTADPSVPVRLVTASRGKAVRAEPVAALYEQGQVHHVEKRTETSLYGGSFAELEDEYQNFTVDGYQGPRSPNRADAAVWALSHLMLAESADGWLEHMRRRAENLLPRVGSAARPVPQTLGAAMRVGTPSSPVPEAVGPVVFIVAPHANFFLPGASGNSKKYTADAEGHVTVLDPEHVAALDRQNRPRLGA